MSDATLDDFLQSLPDLPVRDPLGHKGSYGFSVLTGGARGMSGAICMAGKAALIAGSGLVKLLIPDRILELVAMYAPEYMTVPLKNDELGRICEDADDLLNRSFDPRVTAAAIGPGLGRSNDLTALVRRLFLICPVPLVLDADALFPLDPEFQNSLNQSSQCFSNAPIESQNFSCPLIKTEKKPVRILTPHPGEFARLSGIKVSNESTARKSAAFDFIQKFRELSKMDLILVLKGHETILTDGRECFVNKTGNPGMATGGSGDVLTGLITGLLAQRLPEMNAVRLAVALHGLAGDLAAQDLPCESMLASDLIRYFPKALNFYRKVRLLKAGKER